MDYTQYALNDILKFNINMLYGRQNYTNNNNAYVTAKPLSVTRLLLFIMKMDHTMKILISYIIITQ